MRDFARFVISLLAPYKGTIVWCSILALLAAGMGVEAVRVERADDIAGAVAKAVAAGRPFLVEIAIEGKR